MMVSASRILPTVGLRWEFLSEARRLATATPASTV